MNTKTYLHPSDRQPLSKIGRQAAALVGLSATDYRAGVILQTRAPWHILTAWEAEELSTQQAYQALLRWEGKA